VQIETIYSLLITKNGYLIAEQYFNGRNINSSSPVASVTKSFISALIGLALNEEYLIHLDQKMVTFFPEYLAYMNDQRKNDITIRHLIQMRAGYPFDSVQEFFDQMFASGNWLRFLIRDYALENDPGTVWNYSNGSAHILSGIITKATDMSTYEFAMQFLCNPLNIRIIHWPRDPQGYYAGHGDISIKPRGLAKFGQLYLDKGVYNGEKIIPVEWINESFQDYSDSYYGSIDYFRNIKYGYLWWSADVGNYRVQFAWGHGGNYIVIVPEAEIIVVSTADPFIGNFSQNSWVMEKGIMDVIGEFITLINQ
jgi:CubicO group peptidase (beta-lactamase class C family)